MARIDTFLPAGTKIALRRSNKPAQWYPTQKEIIFNPKDAIAVACPMGTTTKGGEPLMVSRITHQGIDVYFNPLAAEDRLVLEDGDVNPEAFKQTYSTFQYDIPEGVNGPVYPNPSGWLRHIAVRDGWSGWLIKKGDISLARQFEMRQAGCRVTIRDFAEYETAGIVRDIVYSLHAEAEALVRSVNDRRQRAEDALNAAQAEGMTEEQARKKYEASLKAITRESDDKVKAMNEAAASFGLAKANTFVGLNDVSAIIAKNRKDMADRANSYRHAAEVLATVATPEAQAMSGQMMSAFEGDIPVEVVADMLIDAGHEEEADALAKAHGVGVHGAVVNGADDDVFDLT